MNITKEQQAYLDCLNDREATICAIVDILLDHKLTTCEEFLNVKQKHFDQLKQLADKASKQFKPSAKEEQPQDETAIIQCDIKISVSTGSLGEIRQLVDKIRAACAGNYTLGIKLNGEFFKGFNVEAET